MVGSIEGSQPWNMNLYRMTPNFLDIRKAVDPPHLARGIRKRQAEALQDLVRRGM